MIVRFRPYESCRSVEMVSLIFQSLRAHVVHDEGLVCASATGSDRHRAGLVDARKGGGTLAGRGGCGRLHRCSLDLAEALEMMAMSAQGR